MWCKNLLLRGSDGYPPETCPHCGMNPMPGEDPTKGGKVDPKVASRAARNRGSAPKTTRLSTARTGKVVIGVDPGARYTGVVVRDGDCVLHAETIVRPLELQSPTEWALKVTERLAEIIKIHGGKIPMGVEGISDPKGFQNGKRAALNPRDIIRAGIVLGAVVALWPDAVVVAPGKNGSQHYTKYPSVLIGKRPADLPGSTNGAGTRDHEQSAYDVAGKAAGLIFPPTVAPIFS